MTDQSKNYPTFGEVAQKLVDNGYLPIPIMPETKRGLQGWTTYEFSPKDAKKYSGYSVGLRTGCGPIPVYALDFDFNDPEISDYLIEKHNLRHCLRRDCGKGRAQLFFAGTEPGLPRVLSAKYFDGTECNGDKRLMKAHTHQIEFRGAGCQSVIYGFNPDAQAFYQWPDEGRNPLDLRAENLPSITKERIPAILKDFADYINANRKWTLMENGVGQKVLRETGTSFDYAVEKANRPKVTLREASAYLDALPEEICDSRDSWIKVGMALHFQFDGCDEAYQLFDDWSRTSRKYAGTGDTLRVWDSFDRNTSRNPVTIKTVIGWANEAKTKKEVEEKKTILQIEAENIERCEDQYAVQKALKESAVTDPIDKERLASLAQKKIENLTGAKPPIGLVRSFFPLPARPSGFETSQDGNRDRFVEKHAGNLIYVADLDKFFYFNGLIWEEFLYVSAIELASQTMRRIKDEADFAKTDVQAASLIKFCLTSQNYDMYKKVIELAKGDPKILVPKSSLLNARSRYIALENGEFDIEEHKLIEPVREHYITKKCAVKYVEGADCPLWKKTLLEILGTQEKVDYLQRFCGYALAGNPTDDVFMVMTGTGRNGKTTVNNVITEIFGSYAYRATSSSLVRSKHDINNATARGRPEIVDMDGARYVSSVEPGRGLYLDEEVIKALTGRDGYPARRLNSNAIINVKIKGVLNICANDVPRVHDSGTSMRARMQILNFDKCFFGREDVLLPQKLRAEYSGIFNWVVEGHDKYVELGGLFPPEEEKERTTEFFDDAEYESDYVRRFIDEYFTTGALYFTPVDDINRAWNQFVSENGLPESLRGARKGCKQLRNVRDRDGNRIFEDAVNPGKLPKGRYVKGLAFKEEKKNLMFNQ